MKSIKCEVRNRKLILRNVEKQMMNKTVDEINKAKREKPKTNEKSCRKTKYK